ncbi:MAG: hypothetical protein L3J13_10705 [Devosiaceae bacterium]|nr:hypothetical protein [Devosiaceae bacterium]
MTFFRINKTAQKVRELAGDRSGLTSIEMAVAFGVFAVGFAIIATPMLDRPEKQIAASDLYFGQQVDRTVTGSISKPKRFIIRKSVLQPSKTSQCIIFSDGSKYGDC